MVVVAEALQLLVSLVSETTLLSSEHTSKKYAPLGSDKKTIMRFTQKANDTRHLAAASSVAIRARERHYYSRSAAC